MPATVRPETARRDRAKELIDLAGILDGRDECPDAAPLRTAAAQCSDHKCTPYFSHIPGNHDWCYVVERLVFRLTHLLKCIPNGTSSISLALSIRASAEANELWGRSIPDDAIVDPFNFLAINIELVGRQGTKSLYNFWHLDRHIQNSGGESAEYMHPRYHIQNGGSGVEHTINQGSDYGSALIIEPPRLAHPPMDAVLAVDFVLTNFFPQTSHSIREDGQYRNLVRNAQARVWRPYAQALANAWQPIPSTGGWNDDTLWPQLM